MNPALAQLLERSDIRRGDAFAVAPAPTFATGFARLDAELPGGGWPRGALTELLPEQTGIGATCRTWASAPGSNMSTSSHRRSNGSSAWARKPRSRTA